MALSKYYIHASNVHQGGGRALLDALLRAVDFEVYLTVDKRMPLPTEILKSIHIKQVKPSFFDRLNAEIWLFRNVKSTDVVLCFGNLPPLFKLRGRVIVFLQNRYLIDDISLMGFPLKIRLRLEIERLLISFNFKHVDEFIVQTPSMKKLLDKKVRRQVPVRVLAFVADPNSFKRTIEQSINKNHVIYDFVYVASGEPHKNHKNLLEAWCLLAGEGIFPSLCLTLDPIRFQELSELIDDIYQRYRVKVINLCELSHKDALALYKKSGASIYPSKFESFGLPLIEARQAGLPVLAPELDYVREVIDPDQVFNPDSPMSIARAVKRFTFLAEKQLSLVDASQFLTLIVKREIL
jgi:glycosyltransferase involved in cell wall biosynthesis